MKEKKDNHRWWSDFADASFLRNWSYFVDVRKRVGEFLPAGLKNRALRGRNELVQLRLSHCCIFDKTPGENMCGETAYFHRLYSLWISVFQFMSTLYSLNSKTYYPVGHELVSSALPLREVDTPRVRTYLTKEHTSRLFIGWTDCSCVYLLFELTIFVVYFQCNQFISQKDKWLSNPNLTWNR